MQFKGKQQLGSKLEKERKESFSPLKTKLELWFIGLAMPIYPPHRPVCQTRRDAQGRCWHWNERKKERKVSYFGEYKIQIFWL